MSRFFILLVLLIGAINTSRSQNFKAYIIGGVSISQIEGDKLSGYNKLGFEGGLATSFIINDRWSLQQELVFNQRGSRATDKELYLDNFTELRLDYIDFMLLPVYSINEQWSIIGGLGYGFFVQYKSDFERSKSDFKNDLFVTVGPQYHVSDNLLLLVRIKFSMVPAFNNQDAYNNSLGLTARFKL